LDIDQLVQKAVQEVNSTIDYSILEEIQLLLAQNPDLIV
jgi:hypothetical protein